MASPSPGGSRVVWAAPTDHALQDVSQFLEKAGYRIVRSSATASATEILHHHPCVVVIDVSPENSEAALRTIDDLRHHERRLPIILVGTDGSPSLLLRAIRAGAKDFFARPYLPGQIGAAIRDRADEAVARLAPISHRRADDGEPRLVGTSSAVRGIRALIDSFAAHDSTVLVTGETGTGKELVARMIHARSARRAKPFVSVNCPAVPDALLESELFGHERGAFTGAQASNEGKLAAASGGTALFDEIGDMSLSGQAKILGAIETRQVCRLGCHRPVALDVRFIAATNAELDTLIDAGRFRPDLYYRLNVARVRLSPLRERREDIPALLTHYAMHFSARYRRELNFGPDTIDRLCAYDWPGNIRELRNLVEALFASGRRGLVTIRELSMQFDRLLRSTEDAERQQLLTALRACNWNKSKAAQQLRWSRMTLYRKLSKFHMPLSADRGLSWGE